MPIDANQTMLVRQRLAVLRAVQQARARQEDEDAELLQSVAHLLEELHDLAPRVFHRRPTKH